MTIFRARKICDRIFAEYLQMGGVHQSRGDILSFLSFWQFEQIKKAQTSNNFGRWSSLHSLGRDIFNLLTLLDYEFISGADCWIYDQKKGHCASLAGYNAMTTNSTLVSSGDGSFKYNAEP